MRLNHWAKLVKKLVELKEEVAAIGADNLPEDVAYWLEDAAKYAGLIYYSTPFDTFTGYPETVELFEARVNNFGDNSAFSFTDIDSKQVDDWLEHGIHNAASVIEALAIHKAGDDFPNALQDYILKNW